MSDPVTAVAAIGWGVKALGWVASPLICELYKKYSPLLSFEAAEKLRQLAPKILLLEQVVEVVEESPHRPRLEQLFSDLKSALYEAEDILDGVEYYRLEKQVQDCDKKGHLLTKFMSALSGSLVENKETGMSKTQLKMSLEKIEKFTNEAHRILESLNLSNASKGNEKQPIATTSPTTSTSLVKVIGRDEDRKKIIAMLHEEAGHGQTNTGSGLCYSVVGIHGVSGSGKSTLAQFVYAQEEKDKQGIKDGHFDSLIWSHVSKKISLEAIYTQMIQALAAQACDDKRQKLLKTAASWERSGKSSLVHVQEVLKKELSGRRFLLVLDDLWCNKDVGEQNLAHLLSVLEGGKRGSKILVTSRNEDAFSDLGPDVRCITIPISQLDDSKFNELFMYYALGDRTIDGGDGSTLRHIGESIAEKLKKSPLAARTVGGQLRKRQTVEYWRRTKDRDVLNETMGALSWSYQHLNEQLRRCFAYCSMFPRGHHFRRNKLVNLWVAEGFIRTTNAREEMEDVGQDYFDELVSLSFLQSGKESWGQDYYFMHDLFHDLAERIAGSDCYKIENGSDGKVPPGVRHLYVETFDGEESYVGTFEWENLRTLIINRITIASYDTINNIVKRVFTRLRKLRVLNIGFIHTYYAGRLLPVIGLSKHLRHLSLKVNGAPSLQLTIPSSFKKLHQIQTIDFGNCKVFRLSEGEDRINLVSLRHAESDRFWNVVNIVRSTSAQQLRHFTVREEHGHSIEQLRDLNKLRGRLSISSLGIVKSKKEAFEARLADKQRLTGLELSWHLENMWDSVHKRICSPEVKLEVLEGLCPPKDLEELILREYSGPRYPTWMVGRQNGGPNRLQVLDLQGCSLLGLAPVFEVSTQLRVLSLQGCDWVTLPDTMAHLKSLKKLSIRHFPNIEYLPVLSQSIEEFELKGCNEVFTRSCETIENPNWQKIQHIHKKDISIKGVNFDKIVSIIEA